MLGSVRMKYAFFCSELGDDFQVLRQVSCPVSHVKDYLIPIFFQAFTFTLLFI